MNRTPTHVLLLALWLWQTRAALADVVSEVVADSVADFSDVQGLNNWYYGYYDGDPPAPFTPSDFELLPQFFDGEWEIDNAPGGFWTQVGATRFHPNGTFTSGLRQPVVHWAVRRWVSDVAGRHLIRGILEDENPFVGPGNGIVAYIFVDDLEVFTYSLDEAQSTSYSLEVNLSAGAIVDFAVDPRMGSDLTDSTRFTAQIVVPEPPGLVAVFACAGLLMVYRVRVATDNSTS